MTDTHRSPEASFGSPQNPWCRPDGTVIACEEKLKVLRENLAELRQVALDALEDPVPMGCDKNQVKKAFHDEIAALTSGYSASDSPLSRAGGPDGKVWCPPVPKAVALADSLAQTSKRVVDET